MSTKYLHKVMKKTERLKIIISSKGLSQGQLAEIIGVSRQWLCLFLNEKSKIGISTAMRMRDALEIPLDEIY